MSHSRKLHLGRYDVAAFSGFTTYALCSLSIPLVIVAMGRELHFPMEGGGMGAGGVLHLMRSIAMVVAIMFCGSVAGIIGKRRTMGYSLVMMGVGIFLCAFSPFYWFLIPCLLIAGLGEGFIEGIATPFVQDLHKDSPERYVNIAHSFWSIGIGVCVVLAGGLLALGVSWRVVLAAAGVMTLLVALMFLWREHPAHKYPEHPERISPLTVCRQSAAIGKTPRFWVYCLGMFLGAGPEFCLTFWAATFLQINFDAGPWFAGLGTGAIAGGMFLGRTVFGYYAKKKYLSHILLFSALFTIPVTLLLTVVNPEMDSRALMFTILFGLLFLAGFGISPYWPTLQVHGVKSLPELDSTMLYIYFSAVGIPGCGIFTWVLGLLGDRYGLVGAFYLIPASLLLFAAIIFLEGWVFKNKRRL